MRTAVLMGDARLGCGCGITRSLAQSGSLYVTALFMFSHLFLSHLILSYLILS